MALLRLDKYLADLNIGTRSELKKLLKTGVVAINGEVIKKPETKVDTSRDTVTLSGKRLSYERFVYYLLNKPAGVVSATKDNIDKTVIDLLKNEGRDDLFPVGRLDKDTEGFLLLTNDGMLAHELLSPAKHVDKTYYAEIDTNVTNEDVEAFQKGLSIGDEALTLPAKLIILDGGTPSKVMVTLQEGRFHQVKRMFQAVNKKVLYLKRISMGNLSLPPDLKTGEYKKLTEFDIATLKGKTNLCDTEF